jgi:hypothetical protein
MSDARSDSPESSPLPRVEPSNVNRSQAVQHPSPVPGITAQHRERARAVTRARTES